MNQPHKNLEVWKKGIEVAKLIYQVTEKFPKAEKYGLNENKMLTGLMKSLRNRDKE